jgi:glycosyltransferase involved in cell wall biosynthesis
MTRANEVKFHVAIHTGELEAAKEAVLALLKIYPSNEANKKRLKMVEDLITANKASQSIVFLGKTLEESGDKEKLAHLVQAIPSDLSQEKFATEMRHLFLPPKKWESNEIAILCGPGWESWNPDSLKTGIGGSEAAVVLLSQELKKLGWKVTVFANPGPKYGDYDGVNYYQYYDLNPKDEFNALILWRAIGFVDFDPKSKFTMAWLHDVPNNPDFTDDRVGKVNKIAVLSEYHKSLLRISRHGTFEPMPDEKVFLTANGIPEIQIPKIKRDQYKMVYSSSPDRGLVYLLKMWPDIKKEVPRANLHVYYGFEVFDKLYPDNPGRQKWKKMIMEMMKQDGIEYHGRVGREELHKAQASAGIWAYPTDFTEISCITAMECQTLGTIPVCTTLAALNETVKNGLKIDVDITTEEGQEEYKKQLIRLLKDKKLQEEIREPMMKWAPGHFGWDKVAEQWNTMLKLSIQNPELSIKKEV